MIHLSSFEAFLSSSSLVYQSALFVVSLAQQYQPTASLYNLLFSRPFAMRFHYIYWKMQSEVLTLIIALTEQVSLTSFIRLSAPLFNDVMVLGCIACLATVFLFGLRKFQDPKNSLPLICKVNLFSTVLF